MKETQGKILQICHSQGHVKIDRSQIVEDGIQVDGVVYMKVLYIVGNDDMPFYSMEAMIPFSHIVFSYCGGAGNYGGLQVLSSGGAGTVVYDYGRQQ